MKKVSRSVLYGLIRPILAARLKNPLLHPDVDFRRFEVVGFDVKDFTDDELEEFARGLGVLKPDEELER